MVAGGVRRSTLRTKPRCSQCLALSVDCVDATACAHILPLPYHNLLASIPTSVGMASCIEVVYLKYVGAASILVVLYQA